MNRLSFISIVLLAMAFSQEIDTSLVSNEEVLNASIQRSDSSMIDTLAIPLDNPPASAVSITNENDKIDSLNSAKQLPLIRDPASKTIDRLESGEPFFEIKSSIDVLRQQVDSLKKIISVYEEGKGSMPNINEELLDLIKIPQLRHRIELQNGTVVNGEIIEEDDLGIIVQTSIGQLAIEKDKIIQTFLKKEYFCYMTGFIAGMPFLGDTDSKIRLQRLDTPRVKVPKGSVGITEQFCNIYTFESPGGWNIIGNTPIKVFDKFNQKNPAKINPGDRVAFYKINKDEYLKFNE